MRLPVIRGVIDRRILVNYRVQADAASQLLPPPFRPKLVHGYAIAGICLIRLKQVRPSFLPLRAGIGSENAAHRFAVEWERDGGVHEGVFIPRRDSSSRLNALLGGRLVPGEHHHARFEVAENESRLSVGLQSDDGLVQVKVVGQVADRLQSDSIFASLEEVSNE